MNFESNTIKNHRFRYKAFHPDYWSHKLVIKAESQVVLPAMDQDSSPVHLVIVWIGIFAITNWFLYQVMQDLCNIKARGISIFSFFQTPCRNCKYYDDNLYLQCAVNPSQVLTNKAVNCCDYTQKDRIHGKLELKSKI